MSISNQQAVVFGAGKIARGFIAHLLTLSGYEITFVEKSAELVALLKERGEYRVHIMGAPEKSITIRNFHVLASEDTNAISEAVATASLVFVSIGGPNLWQIAPLLAAGLRRRREALNIILCENYFQPALLLRRQIEEFLDSEAIAWCSQNLGIVETMVLRSTIEPTPELKAEDPLALKAQDMWEMPADKDAFVGELPRVEGLAPKENFQGGLIRKLFTYNAINAVISYHGHLKGYALLADAANDPELVAEARAAYHEVAPALCARYGFDPEDQLRFAESAIVKYQKREIVDPIERNTRDPIRKLARHDRLVGPACLAFDHGTQPAALSRAIAAALRYDSPADPSAGRLQQLIREQGIREVLRQVCGIEPNSPLADLITSAYEKP